MTFSIIIPTYNRATILTDTINSVLHQTYSGFEVIIVDDGSTDNTRQVVETISDHRVRYYHKKNEERSIARNFGAQQAKGRYLIFLDSDDRMQGGHLAGIHDYLALKNFDPLFVFSGFVVSDPNGRTVFQFKKKGILPPDKLLYGNYLGCSAVTIEKKLFDKHRFNTSADLIVFEDWELWLRVISETALHCIPAASIVMFNHTNRSVLNFSAAQFEKKAEYFFSSVTQNVPVLKHSSSARRKLKMGLYSYIALHVALAKEGRLLVLKFLMKALIRDPGILIRRRFYAIIKHIF